MKLFQSKLYAIFSITGGILPVIYIWSLPYLASSGFAKPGPDPLGIGYSISSYISNAQATGMMAACFYYPCIQMWSDNGLLNYVEAMNNDDVKLQKKSQYTISFCSLFIFQMNFGLFLAFPVDKFNSLHGFTVATFSTTGLLHYYYLIKIGDKFGGISKIGKIPLYTSSIAFALILAMSGLKSLFPGLSYGHLFWAVECIALSGMSLGPSIGRI